MLILQGAGEGVCHTTSPSEQAPGCYSELEFCPGPAARDYSWPEKRSLGPALPSSQPAWGLQPSAPTCQSPTAGKSSFLIPRASYSSERAESWEEITSPEGRASSADYFSGLPLEPMICHSLSKQAPYHITNIYLTLFSCTFTSRERESLSKAASALWQKC